MALTARTTVEDGNPIVWIDKDGYPALRQPHHPQAFMNAPWTSEAEALAWGEQYIAELEASQA